MTDAFHTDFSSSPFPSSPSFSSLSLYREGEESRRKFYLARHHFEKHEYHLAQSFLAPLLQEIHEGHKAENPDISYMWGCCLYYQGSFKEAVRYLQKAILLEPSHQSAKTILSILLNDLGQYEEAENLFQDLQRQKRSSFSKRFLSPSFKRQLLAKYDELAQIYFEDGWNEEAISFWRQSLSFVNSGEQLHDITLKLCFCYLRWGKEKTEFMELLEQVYAHPLSDETLKEKIHIYILQMEKKLFPCNKAPMLGFTPKSIEP